MKSIELLFAEAIDQLEAKGKRPFAQSIIRSTQSLEKRLALCERELRGPTPKHNGVAHNHGGSASESDQEKERGARMVESFKSLGLSQREAEVAAGVSHQDDLAEAVKDGSNAADFWEAIRSMRD